MTEPSAEQEAVMTALRTYLRTPGESIPEQHVPWWQGMADAAITALDEHRVSRCEPTCSCAQARAEGACVLGGPICPPLSRTGGTDADE